MLTAAGFEADYVEADIGWEYWRSEGNPLPQRTLDLIAEHKLALFAAITSKPKEEAAAELSPDLLDQGFVYSSPIVGLRQYFDLDVCIRPCRSYPGNPLNFVRRNAAGELEEPKVDAVIFRQNTEGLYAGVEWSDPPENVHVALKSHPKFEQGFTNTPKDELAISTRIFSRNATENILRAAFEYATRHGYPSVTLCEKPNVIRETSGLMWRLAKEIQSSDYPDIQLWNTNIDAQMMWLTKNPEDYGVIVAGNMFGDIVSDAFAGLVGGLGFACSAQYNSESGIAVFEPTHGSAPKYADAPTPFVNPIAMIASAVMLLEHLGETEKAQCIQQAISTVIAEGQVKSYDMLRLPGSSAVLDQDAASTRQMADAVIAQL